MKIRVWGLQVRNLVVEAISDGSYLAPLMQFGEMVSSKAPTYMYVFSDGNHHHEKDKKVRGAISCQTSVLAVIFSIREVTGILFVIFIGTTFMSFIFLCK